MVADVTHTTFNLDQSEQSHFSGKLLIGQPSSRAARQKTERERERAPPLLLTTNNLSKFHVPAIS